MANPALSNNPAFRRNATPSAATLEELGDHEAAVETLSQAVARHDVWAVQFPRIFLYERLRRDPRVAVMFDRLMAK